MNANDEWTEKVMQSLVESEAAGKDSKSKVKVKGKRYVRLVGVTHVFCVCIHP